MHHMICIICCISTKNQSVNLKKVRPLKNAHFYSKGLNVDYAETIKLYTDINDVMKEIVLAFMANTQDLKFIRIGMPTVGFNWANRESL